MKEVMPLLILLINTVTDIKRREISLVCTGTGFLWGMTDMIRTERINGMWMLGLLFGAAFILTSVLTKERIGAGDGLVILALSTVIEMESLLLIICIALFLCQTVFLFLRKSHNHFEVPFIPYLLAGYFLERFL